jgi:hypothetical protein
MKLTDLDNKPAVTASRALAQNYEVPFNVDRMGMVNTVSMLNKVRGLMRESRESRDFYQAQSTPGYMKLVFMEQALSHHYQALKSQPRSRIIYENEEVEKSQVVLAAQDMVDSTQKMLEEVSDMLVKELPALTTSINNEMGQESGQAFNQSVTEALTQLQAAITAARGGLQGALGGITGQGGGNAFGGGADDMEMGADDMEAGMDDMEAGMDDMDAGMDDMDDGVSAEEPESEPVSGVGRGRR